MNAPEWFSEKFSELMSDVSVSSSRKKQCAIAPQLAEIDANLNQQWQT